MRKTIGGFVGILLLSGGIGLAWAYREQLTFFFSLLQTYRTARRFYADYENLTRDVVFDPALQTRLDVFSPPTGTEHPVLLFVHGGAWRSYHKELFSPVAMTMLPEDLVVVIPDYSLYPSAGYEQMAHEVAAAINWTLENIEQYGGDPRRVVVAGHSAGAHLMGLAVMDPRFLAAYGRTGTELCGLVGLSGVYDVQAEYDFWRAKGSNPRIITGVMGGIDNFRQASPLSHVRAGLPPFLLIHGDQDESVPVGIAADFYAALQASGVPVELKIYPGATHSDYLFAGLANRDARLVTDLASFVRGCRP